MNGVTILNTCQEYTNLQALGLGFGAVVACVAAIFLVGFMFEKTHNTFLSFVVPIIVFVMALCGLLRIPSSEDHYEVMIDDSVSMTEFNEKYEIIEQRGMIYKVKERERR